MTMPALRLEKVAQELPDIITLRIVQPFGSAAVLAVAGGEVLASLDLDFCEDPGEVIAGAEAVLAILGYRLDREGIYFDMGLTVARFRRDL